MPLDATHPRLDNANRQVDYMRGVQPYAKKLLWSELTAAGTTTFVLGRVGPGAVIGVIVIKKTDFDGTVTFDLGVNFVGSTADDLDSIVNDHNLTSSSVQGVLRATMVDDSEAYIEADADLTLTVTAGGTPTAGEAMIVVEFVPFEVATYGRGT